MQEQMEKPAPQIQDEGEIDLLELFHVLWSKVTVLIASLILGAMAAGLITKVFITPQYQATSMIYIYSKTTSITSLTDLQIGTQLTVDFQIIATTREVIEDVIETLQLDAEYEDVLESLTINNPSGSRVLQLTVENPDPQLAADISNALADRLRQQVAEVMSTDKPSLVQQAVVPTRPSSPSLLKNMAIGGMLTFVVVAGVILLLYLLDDTITSSDDVTKYLGLNTIAEIPLEHDQEEKSTSINRQKKKKSSGSSSSGRRSARGSAGAPAEARH